MSGKDDLVKGGLVDGDGQGGQKQVDPGGPGGECDGTTPAALMERCKHLQDENKKLTARVADEIEKWFRKEEEIEKLTKELAEAKGTGKNETLLIALQEAEREKEKLVKQVEGLNKQVAELNEKLSGLKRAGVKDKDKLAVDRKTLARIVSLMWNHKVHELSKPRVPGLVAGLFGIKDKGAAIEQVHALLDVNREG